MPQLELYDELGSKRSLHLVADFWSAPALVTSTMRKRALPSIFGQRSIYGSLTGTPIDSEDTLAFSVLQNIRPMIEPFPLEKAADAYARMIACSHSSVVSLKYDGKQRN